MKKVFITLLIAVCAIGYGQRQLQIYPKDLVAGDSVSVFPVDRIFGLSVEMYSAAGDSAIFTGRVMTLHGESFNNSVIDPSSIPFNIGFIEKYVLDTCIVRAYGYGRLFLYKTKD